MTTESHEAPGEAEDVIEITAVITSDDWTEASMRNDRGHLASRRRVALFGDLALLPIGLLFIALVFWKTGGRRAALEDIVLLDAPAGMHETILLWFVVCTLFVAGSYAVHDRSVRWRLRRWAARRHGTEPISVHCRLTARGMTATDRYGTLFRSWASVVDLEETERHFFLTDADCGGAIVPKRDMSDAEQARIRAFVRERLLRVGDDPEPLTAVLPQEATREAGVHLHYERTVEDQIAGDLLLWAMTSGRRRRALTALGSALVVALGMSSFDAARFCLAWLAAGRNEPFDEPFAAIMLDGAAGYLWIALCAAGFGLSVWLTWPWFLRRQAEASARSRPDVPVDLALGEAGVTVAVPGTWIRYAWSSVQAVLESRDHVGLLLPLSAVLVIPKRALDEDRLAELRHLLTRRIDQPKA